MKFDDFNYEVYNPYIFVQEDKTKTKEEKDAERESISKMTSLNQVNGMEMSPERPGLTEHALEAQVLGRYDFQSISVKTPEHSEEPKDKISELQKAIAKEQQKTEEDEKAKAGAQAGMKTQRSDEEEETSSPMKLKLVSKKQSGMKLGFAALSKQIAGAREGEEDAEGEDKGEDAKSKEDENAEQRSL